MANDLMRSSEQQKISFKAEDRSHEEGAEAEEWEVAWGYRRQGVSLGAAGELRPALP